MRIDETASARRSFTDSQSRRQEQPDRSYKLLHIAIDITLEPEEKRLRGEVTHRLRPLTPDLRAVVFDCAELEVEEARLGGREPLSFEHQGDKLTVMLPKPVGLDDEIEVCVRYHGRPRTGLYFIAPSAAYPNRFAHVWTQGEQEDTRYWVPTYDAPNDRATTELKATVPQGWLAISNGKLVAETPAGGGRQTCFHYRLDVPHVTYLLTLAAGPFDKHVEVVDGVPLEVYVPPGRPVDEVKRSFAKTGEMLRLFGRLTGLPYPYPKYAQVVVQDFTFGGMENTSATTLTDRTFHDERAHSDFKSEPLVSHELAHQWFGDLITCRSWAHVWLNESFATYFEALWAEHDLGADEMVVNLLDKADTHYKEDAEHYRRPLVTEVYTDPGDLFDRHAYEKGACILHILRGVMGDEAFFRGLKAYVRRCQGRSVETAELRLALEEETGQSLGWFFEQWVMGEGYPVLAVEERYEAEAGQLVLTIKQTQDGRVFRLPLDVRVETAQGAVTRRLDIRGRETTFVLPLEARPLDVLIDPACKLVLKGLSYPRPVERLARTLAHAEEVAPRIDAVRALAGVGGAKAVATLARAFKDDRFWAVRARAAKALAVAKGDAAHAALLQGLADPDSRVRRAVCQALGDFKDARALAELKRILESDPSYYARGEAAVAIGKLAQPGSLEILKLAMAQESHDEVVRRKAADGVAELKDPAGVAVLEEAIAYGRPPKAREAAIVALAKLGKTQEKDRVKTALMKLLDDPYVFARLWAIEGLGDLGVAEAIPALEVAARRELDSRNRRSARLALRAIREEAAARETPQADLESMREETRRLARRVAELEARKSP